MKLVYRNSDRFIIAVLTVGSGSDHVSWDGDNLVVDEGYSVVDISEYPIMMGPSRYTEDGVVELISDYSPF